MGSDGWDNASFVASQHTGLVRAALLLTADEASAQDLAQETVIKVLQHPRRVAAAADPVAYTRRIMLNLFLAGRRRRWSGEVAHAEPPQPGVDGAFGAVEDRDLLRRALRTLPPRQRAAVLLRHYEQRPEAEAAALMGCSVGNIKSLASRGMASLREALRAESQELA